MIKYVPIRPPKDNAVANMSSFSKYAEWCDKVAGPENEEWWWKRGNMYGQGIYFKDEQVALMFKLKFPV
jgi:hypothetical protein